MSVCAWACVDKVCYEELTHVGLKAEQFSMYGVPTGDQETQGSNSARV